MTSWPFSTSVCKMTGFVQTISVSASVFTLVAIAIERFRCIVYPLQPKPSIMVAKVAIMLIWLLAVAISLPTMIALTVKLSPNRYMYYGNDLNNTGPFYYCYENFTNPKMRKVYTAVLFTHIYMLPLTFITVMYGSIGVKLYTSVVANREPQQANGNARQNGHRISKKKIRVIKMLTLVALLFLLSWLPLWTLLMMVDYGELERNQMDVLATYCFPFAHWLAFSNSSVNPIIYGYYNENFKRGFQALCKFKPSCCSVQCRMWRSVACWSRRRNNVAVQVDEGSVNANDGTRNHLVMTVRNKQPDDDKRTDSGESKKSARVECLVVRTENTLEGATQNKHLHSTQGTTDGASSAGPSVYQAWEK